MNGYAVVCDGVEYRPTFYQDGAWTGGAQYIAECDLPRKRLKKILIGARMCQQ
jgi:hypothetical protein